MSISASIKKTRKCLVAKSKAVWRALRPSIIRYRENSQKNTKWALLSYIPSAINLRDDSPRLLGHSNKWECREIARILSSLGYNVDAMNCMDSQTIPSRQYDLILDIGRNVQRLAPFQKKTTKYILLLTGSHHKWAIESEGRRIEQFEMEHGCFYVPRYGELPLYSLDKSLRIATCAMLIGNDVTLATYPEWCRKKIIKIPVTASMLEHVKTYRKTTGEFLYFNGPRNIVKGLDLCIDAFVRHPEWKLHVVGSMRRERDFMAAYPAIQNAKNILFHGWMVPSSDDFAQLIDQCDAFLAPSCSDGTATAVLTALSSGLYPILSPHTGVDLPENCGIWIDDLTVQGVEQNIELFQTKCVEDISREAIAAREFSMSKHNRSAFSESVRRILEQL